MQKIRFCGQKGGRGSNKSVKSVDVIYVKPLTAVTYFANAKPLSLAPGVRPSDGRAVVYYSLFLREDLYHVANERHYLICSLIGPICRFCRGFLVDAMH